MQLLLVAQALTWLQQLAFAHEVQAVSPGAGEHSWLPDELLDELPPVH